MLFKAQIQNMLLSSSFSWRRDSSESASGMEQGRST